MKKIEILKLPPYYYPERISSSHLTCDLNEAFRDAGLHTTAYVPMPCRGIDDATRKSYKSIKHQILEHESIDIYRFSMYKEGVNPVGRALRYILCNIIQYYRGVKTPNVDVVFAGSTPPTQGILCGKVAKKLSKKYGYKVPFIYNLQDVFPDSLVSSGMTSTGSLVWKIGRVIENYTYKNADKIVVIGEDIKKNIVNKGVPENKVVIIPNWIDITKVVSVERENNKLFDELNIDRDKFIVTYAGNMGTAQGIDTIFQAAKLLKDNTNILFVIFGGGIHKQRYSEMAEMLHNVKVFDLYPADRVSEVYSLGDLSIVSCKKGVGYGAVPSKSLSIMATGTPVILSFDEDTELWDLVKKNDCGYVSPAEDSNYLAKVILEASLESDVVLKKGNNARNTVIRLFSKELCTQKYVELFLEMTSRE